jgi:hypothetical protein
MDTWISVAPQSANVPQIETVRGIQVQVFASPHDVPVGIKGAFEKGCDRFVINLRYVDQDNSGLLPVVSDDGVVSVFKGISSGRVERIEVDVNKEKASAVALNILIPSSTHLIDQVESQLKKLRNSQETLSSRLNYLAVTEALEQSKELLLAS